MQKVEFENKNLLDLFPETLLGDDSLNIFRKTQILNINVYQKSEKLEILASSDVLIPATGINRFEEKLSCIFGLKNVSLRLKFNIDLSLEEIITRYRNDILFYVFKKVALSRGILGGAEFFLETDKKLLIKLNTKGAEILKFRGCDKFIEKLIENLFSHKVKVEFLDFENNSSVFKNYLEEKASEELKAVNSISIENSNPSYEKTKVNKVVEDKSKKPKYTKQNSTPSDILGKSITDKSNKMIEITQDSGTVVISGEIFKIEMREIRGGKYLFMFDITDYTTSLTVKFFVKSEDVGSMKEKLTIGKWVKVRGDAQYDKFSRELAIFAADIMSIENKNIKRMDNAETKRVELHLHTQMSAMDGVTPVKELIKRAASWGHKAIAITDHGVVQAYPDAAEAASKHKIKVIYGVECYIVDDETTLGEVDFKKIPTKHAIILVKNYIGLKNLYEIISKSHLNYFHKRPRVPKSLLNLYREGLVLGGGCEAGEIFCAVLDKKDEKELERIVTFYDYLEVQPLGNNQFLIQKEKVSSEEEIRNINKKIIELGEIYKKPVVATCDVHFMDPRDEVYRRILMAGKGFQDADNQAPLYFRTTEEMLNEFSYLEYNKAFEIVVTNTNLIADMIEEIVPIPDGTFPPKIDGAEQEIRRLTEEKVAEIYGNVLPDVVKARMEKELNSIIKNGFSVMYIIAQKLVWKSLEDGYLVGSRGSVGSSFVANMIGITEVNSLPPHYICEKCKYSEFIVDGSVGCGFDLPNKTCPECAMQLKKDGYDIPFETFLGFDGDKEPDIDLNFSGEYQHVAHKYTEELFGEGHVYRAGTIGTIAEKTAFGFVKNYFDERNVVATNAEISRIIMGCTGVKRTTGQHPGGVMIVPQDKDIFEFCPIQRPADDTESDIITTHFDYHSISGRLLKLDILGHDDPTVIRMLEDLTGVDARGIPIGEKKTMGIFSSTEALGIKPEDIDSEVGTFAIPEFGTKFVRQMLVDTKPTTFSELIRISGLSHGTDVWLNNAQDLIRNGNATLAEVICTRDDIMLYLIYSGLPPKTAFKIMEDVRKGKGLKEEYEEIMKEKNVPAWYIDSCKKIKYMFPKAHAAAYVMMAFRIAWFKVYYPEAFYVTYFTVRADDFDASIMTHGREKVKMAMKELERKGNNMTQKEKNVLTILEVTNEMYARGINFLPIDLYESDAEKFQILPSGIRPPLLALQGLGITAAENIVEARREGTFVSKEDLRIRAKVTKTVIEILEQQKCLDGMPESNQLSLF